MGQTKVGYYGRREREGVLPSGKKYKSSRSPFTKVEHIDGSWKSVPTGEGSNKHSTVNLGKGRTLVKTDYNDLYSEKKKRATPSRTVVKSGTTPGGRVYRVENDVTGKGTKRVSVANPQDNSTASNYGVRYSKTTQKRKSGEKIISKRVGYNNEGKIAKGPTKKFTTNKDEPYTVNGAVKKRK